MGINRVVVTAVMAAWGCGSNAPDGGSNTPDGASDLPPPTGLHDACRLASQAEITAQAARDLGFSVDPELAILARAHQASFHRGVFACSDGGIPSADGQIAIRPTLQRIELRVREPAFDYVDPAKCTDYLVLRTKVEFSTDEGTISGQFEAEGVSYLDGVYLSLSVDSKQCAGSLGIRLDRNRPSRGFVSITMRLRDGFPTGQLYTGVIYTDVELLTGEEGDGIFWPADDLENHCGWLEGSSPMISLDEYNQL